MNTPVFRKVTSPQEWETSVSLRNELLWQRPITLSEVQDWLGRIPEDVHTSRYLMSVDGVDVGMYSLLTPYWMEAPGRLEIHAHSREPRLFCALLHEAMLQAGKEGASKVGFWARTDRPEQYEALASADFTETQRNPEAGIDLTKFDPMAYADLIDGLSGTGYSFCSYQEYGHQNPKTWQEEAWRLEMDVLNDVPFPEPHKEDTLDEFVKQLESPFTRLDAMFLAIKDGELAGMSQLTPNQVDNKVMTTGLTGVRRDHRRKGLATALKAVALGWAKDAGAQWVFTDNEENNPMYDLNLKLGFTKQFDWVCMEKLI